MRIQHNITAMNSYRNFSANTSNLGKNLEKLSSGYKINRAGDDAAGLAISEKMRAQITGIEGATKNAKDGISLIQTAEGALTEVHDMLNRMTTLAEQSANGTYQNELDREQLQKEVSQLKEEIDRIADSTNFNGLKLLDGSLSGASNIKGGITVKDIEATYAKAATGALAANDTPFVDSANAAAAGKVGDKVSYTVSWKDGDGNDKSTTVEFTLGKKNGDATTDNSASALIAADGTKYEITGGKFAAAAATAAGLQKGIIDELNKNSEFSANFTASVATATSIAATAGDGDGVASTDKGFLFTSKVAGTAGATVQSAQLKTHSLNEDSGTYVTRSIGGDNAADVGTITARSNARDAGQELNLDNIHVLDADDYKKTDSTVQDSIFEVGGKKFALYGAGDNTSIQNMKEAVGSDVTLIQVTHSGDNEDGGGTYVADAADAKIIAGELTRVTGMKFGFDGSKVITAGDTRLQAVKGKSLDLQIGDTADEFNKLSVSVGDMHAKAIGIGDVDISTQDGAAAALDKIKSAINNVSDTRGTLGSLQNRLEHTINNLGVQRENIQNAESLIRDTDVAEEMMEYTKNNILNQSAQAMLAQANQLPQGVLQLLG